MARSTGSRICNLVLRICMLVLLLISLIVLTTNTKTIEVADGAVKLRFQDVYAYRYELAATVIGLIYILLQVGLSIFQVISMGDGFALLDFYGDMFFSYMLATGSAAGFGVTLDMKQLFDGAGLHFGDFYSKAYASCSLLLLAFLCAAISSIMAAYALPKRI